MAGRQLRKVYRFCRKASAVHPYWLSGNATFASIDGPSGLVFDSADDLFFSNEGIILNSGPSWSSSLPVP